MIIFLLKQHLIQLENCSRCDSYRIQGQNYPNYQIINSDTSNVRYSNINFGSSKLLHNNGKLRNGKINITYTGKYQRLLISYYNYFR